MEASVRLKYASVLFQETENFAEAEETLSKGVSSPEWHNPIHTDPLVDFSL